ncbi:hypothetical protein CBR_g46585 [Chara braunii]|uniref:Uncharacterized protein n=1 Tax=Chara braunii TaxID=69332 RepID=A0A388M0L5_CHABU|nr:hypothetical protein CBR_g46585 [Chara braunii]|eukprot:GBG88096.1 hypothetical protein CBR_g46585 [Chara braunii]
MQRTLRGGTDRTAEQVYFTYGGGSDDHAPRTSVIMDDVEGGAQGSTTRRPQAVRGRGAVDRDGPPRARRILGVDSNDEDEGEADSTEHLRDHRFDPSHHSREQSEQLRRSHRVGDKVEYRTNVREREETVEERDARLDCEEEALLQSMPRWASREAYEAEQRRQRELETTGVGSQASVGPLPTQDTMRPPSHAEGVGADRCGLDARGGGLTDVRCEAESSDDGDECEAAEPIIHDVVVGICVADTDGGIHGGEEEMVEEVSVPLPPDAAQVEEELVDEGSDASVG